MSRKYWAWAAVAVAVFAFMHFGPSSSPVKRSGVLGIEEGYSE